MLDSTIPGVSNGMNLLGFAFIIRLCATGAAQSDMDLFAHEDVSDVSLAVQGAE